VATGDLREYDRTVRRKTPGGGLQLPTTWSFFTKYSLIGMLLGALVGQLAGNVVIGLTIGFITGAVGGLIAGWRIGGRIEHDLEVPPVPPPGGWRRWDDEDDSD
jgi:uncharacterized membrane protein